MSTYGPRFITPPTDDQEIYPYSPVWRPLVIQTSILAAITLLLYTTMDVFKLSLSSRLQPYIGLSLIIAPCVVWLIFSWWAESRVSQPRRHLITVIILAMLAANSVGVPLIDQYFRVEAWLPLAPAINRIVGYTLTAGVVHGTIKYLVLHYTIWPLNIRARIDGVAYGIAAGIGYATILNIQFIIANPPAPSDIVAFHVFANYTLHVSTGIIIGYGLSEVYFSNPTPIFLTIALFITAVITGITIPIHAGLVNSSLSITSISAPKPLFGLGFSAILLVIVSAIVAGLIGNADRLEREARTDSE